MIGRRLLLGAGLAALMGGCALSGPPAPTASQRPPSPTVRATAAAVVDCGVSDLGPGITYDLTGRECVWNAYSAGTPTRWIVTKYTTEGAPIRESFAFESGVVLMTRDMSADAFSGPADRRLWSWRCSAMVKRPFVTDPQHYSFELTNCTGDFEPAYFP
jgi:hypothetical protein